VSTTVTVASSVLFAAVGGGLALAFGLGGRDMAKDYLEKRLRGKAEEEDGFTHI